MKNKRIKKTFAIVAITLSGAMFMPVLAYADEIGIEQEIIIDAPLIQDMSEIEDSEEQQGEVISDTLAFSDENANPVISDNADKNVQDGEENEEADDGIGMTGGYIPIDPGYEIPLLAPKKRLLLRSSNLPSSYNPYEDGKLPAIKNQNPYNTCWAFSTIGALETDLIAKNESRDLSELYMAYYGTHTFNDEKGCRTDTMECAGGEWLDNGGNPIMASRVLANLAGPIAENDAPYTQAYGFNPNKTYINSISLKNAYFININDVSSIKSAIMAHGGVSAAYYDSDSATDFNSSTHAYYYTGTGTNHAVMFVGWDDNFDKNNFKRTPAGDGAWLVRNSWGMEGYGHRGYFWLSYFDGGFKSSDNVVAFDTDTDTYDHCYAYDGQPIASDTYTAYDTVTVKQTYNVDAQEAVKAVNFEIGSANITAEVTAKNLSTGKSTSATVHTTFAGIYTAKFDTPLNVPSDAEIEVSIKYTSKDDGGAILIVCEKEGTFYYGAKNAKLVGVCNRTFYLNNFETDCDPRIRLYTCDAECPPENIPVTGLSIDRYDEVITIGDSFTIKATISPDNATDKKITWNSSKEKVATVSNGKVVGKSAGMTTITATSADGGFTASCNVMVNPIYIDKITLSSDKVALNKGDETKLTATFSPDNATNKQVIWESDDPAIATVTADGTVKGIKEGATYIKCIATDGSEVCAYCEVTVKQASPVPESTPTPNPAPTPSPTPSQVKTSIENAKVVLSASSFTYNGQKQIPAIKTIGGKVLNPDKDYTIQWSDTTSVNAGNYSITMTGKGQYQGRTTAAYVINKASNTLKVSSKKKEYKISYSKLKKKNQSIAASKVYRISKNNGKVTYKKKSGNKKITVSKNGKITIKKGLKKGTYKIKVKATAAGDKNHKAGTKTVALTIQVK